MSSAIAPLQQLHDYQWLRPLQQLFVLRLDLIAPAYSGNKYFKLKHTLQQARDSGIDCLVSFGGAYSNHIHALALAGQLHGLKTVGVIRGDRTPALNPTLKDAESAGMELHFVSRQEYRLRYDANYLAQLAERFQNSYIIPEGGSNVNAVRGSMDIVDHIHHAIGHDYDVIVLPCGTAATLAGIVAALPADKQVIGISVLKNATDLAAKVISYLKALGVNSTGNWHIEHGYHCGGYAKINKALVHLMHDVSLRHSIPLEPVYSGKMFYALSQLAIQPNARVVAIHTGGLQGLRGMQPKIDQLLAL